MVVWQLTDEEFAAYVRSWDRVQRAFAHHRVGPGLPEPAASNGTILVPPATEDELIAAERRLGVRLPPSYRSFLSVSNGAYGDDRGFVDSGEQTEAGYGFLPVGEVFRTTDDPAWLALWMAEEFREPSPLDQPLGLEPVTVGYLVGIEDGLVISRPDGAHRVVLRPRADGEWDFLSFDWEGAIGHASFEMWLQWTVREPTPPQITATIRALSVREASPSSIHKLAEEGDPRVLELSVWLLENGSDSDAAVGAVYLTQLVGEDGERHVPLLRHRLDAIPVSAPLGFARRGPLLSALIACGDPEARGRLERIAESDPDERLQEWARQWLAEHPE